MNDGQGGSAAVSAELEECFEGIESSLRLPIPDSCTALMIWKE